MRITLIGLGLGTPGTISAEGLAALREADLIAGAQRLLESLPAGCTGNRRAAVKPLELCRALEGGWQAPCVVYSGDTGFYSGARSLEPLLREGGHEVRILPGISSVQYLAAKLLRPWQGWRLVSAHGAACDPVAAVRGQAAFFLTGGVQGPAALCRELARAGLGGLQAVVGERLSYPEERILYGTAEEFAGREFDPLNVLLVEAAPVKREAAAQGIADGAFLRGRAPMTKQEVRAAALAKLAVGPEDTLWDVGAGTGSVSVEMALLAKKGRVFAVERDPEACGLIEENRERFGAYGLQVVPGEAPGALAGLPAPDAVFIGGSGGALEGILQAVGEKNPQARVCVTAVTVETLSAALGALEGMGKSTRVTQLAVSRSRQAGRAHMLLAENPVYLITGDCHE